MDSGVVSMVEYRVVHPDGRLLYQWIVSSQIDRSWSPTMTPYIWLDGEQWSGPWRVERRTSGEWKAIDDSDAAATRWATLRPPAG